MSLSSLYSRLERCERELDKTRKELKVLQDELRVCKEKQTQYEKQKNNFHDIIDGERKVVGHLYNITSRNKLSTRLHRVMNDKFHGRECTRTIDSSNSISRTIVEIIRRLEEQITQKKNRISSLQQEIHHIHEEIRREKERQRHKHKHNS